MFHLLVLACMATGPCAEHWLPQADRPAQAACEAAAPGIAAPWAEAQGLAIRQTRCVPTGALPALPLDQVAPQVWIHRGADSEATAENGGAIANLGVIAAPRGVVVVDPGSSRGEGERLLAAIRQMTDAPVVAVILTHLHPDHSYGAAPFTEAGAQIIAHHLLPEALSARTEAYATTWRASIGDAAWIGSAPVLPDRLIAAPTQLDLGGADFILTPVGPAHTETDLTVYHPDSGTLFTGDLAFRGLTPVVDASLSGWRAWLAEPPAPAPKRIVPGHGPVAEDWQTATRATRAYLDALGAAVRGVLDRNLALSAAVPAVLEAMQPQADGWADFAATTRRNTAAAYHEMEWE